MDTTLTLSSQDRARGALLGLAVGDAIGAQVEFAPRGSFPPVTDMVGGGPHRLKAGEWTDDTSTAVCLAESLVELQRFDPVDQLQRYVRWWREGYHSPKGYCFDIGGTTARSLSEFERTGAPYRAMSDMNGGNGSLMRLAPIPMAFKDHALVAQYAEAQGMTTHASEEANAACRAYALMTRRALDGLSKEEVLDPASLMAEPGLGTLPEKILQIVKGSYRTKPESQIRSGGYVVESLEAALWCVWRATNFQEAILMAANLGHDADTTAAIAGQLAGALWGESGIPEGWREKLYKRNELVALADALYEWEPTPQPVASP